MKSAVLTTVSALVLASLFATPTVGTGAETDGTGIDTMTTGSTVSASTKDHVSLPGKDATSELAQAEMPAKPAQPAVEATETDTAVDESALRFFARKGDKVRLNAEIARLRTLFPNWTPPSDPLAGPDMVDPQLASMWKLYAAAKYDEVRKAIADRQRTEQAWKAPADLLDKLAMAETRADLVTASEARRFDEVVDLGARAPGLLTCENVDVLWRVAEAFGNSARLPRALDAYGYILDNCTTQPERLATMMKAAAVLGYSDMQTLIAREKTAADGIAEFEPIRDDLARRFVGEGGINAKLAVAQSYLDRAERLVADQGKASDALLLGWYHVKRKSMTEAGMFFRKAHDIEDTASASQGLALTLIAAKNPKEAEDVMYKWRDSSGEAWATYFAATANLLAVQPPRVIDPEVLARIAEAVTEKREIKTAENFGWYALSFQQPRTAAQWFRSTLGWKPDYEPAAYGLTVARLRLKDQAGVKQMQKLWRGRSERIATILEPRRKKKAEALDDVPSPDSVVPDYPGVDGYETQSIDPVDGIDRDLTTRSISKPVVVAQATTTKARAQGCGRRVDPATLSPRAALDRGWCLMNLNRPTEAAAAFDVALRSPSAKAREDAAYGQSLAYLRAGLVDQAAISATKAKQGVKRAVELQTAILADRALNAYNAGRFRQAVLYLDQLAQLQSERTDLMVVRAYSYRQLGRKIEAVRIFESLAATGNRDAISALGEIRSEELRGEGHD